MFAKSCDHIVQPNGQLSVTDQLASKGGRKLCIDTWRRQTQEATVEASYANMRKNEALLQWSYAKLQQTPSDKLEEQCVRCDNWTRPLHTVWPNQLPDGQQRRSLFTSRNFLESLYCMIGCWGMWMFLHDPALLQRQHFASFHQLIWSKRDWNSRKMKACII